MPIKRLVVITSSAFPRWKDDTESMHMFLINNNLAKKGYNLLMLAPHHRGAKTDEIMGRLRVHRFPYFFPRSFQKLCYDGGILLNMKKSVLAKIQLPFFIISETVSLLIQAKKHKADFIQANWILPQGIAALIAKKILKVRYGVSAHAADLFPMKAKILRLLLKSVLKNADLCISNSTYTKSFLEKIYSPKNSIVIPIGIDLSTYKKDNKEVSRIKKKFNIDKYIFYLGRFIEKKGIPYLIDAMPSVIRKHPDIKLVLAGGGPDLEKTKSLVKKKGLEESIIITGRLLNEDIIPLYSGAKIFVGPSIIDSSGDTEGLGVVFLEALACETPVIASDVGGIPDIIIHEKTGILVPQKDSISLSKAISGLLEDDKKQRRLANNGYEHLKNNFVWEKVIEKFDEAYKKNV